MEIKVLFRELAGQWLKRRQTGLIAESPFDAPGIPFNDGFIGRLSLQRANPPLRYNTESSFQAYATHELIYACINKLADVINDAEMIVETKGSDGNWQKKEGHPLVSLFKRPNPIESGRDFRRMLCQSEQATGLFYAQITRSAAGLPAELHPLNPLRIQIWPNMETGQVKFYRYLRADGKFYDIFPEDMLVKRRTDITNRFFGLAPLHVALKSINSDIGLTDYVDAFFESDGTPSGILKILNQSLPETKKDAIFAQWKKRFSRGGNNQKGIAVLDQDVNFESIGSKLKELAIDQVSDRFESRICSVFGVPPILVGSWVGLKHTTANATAKAALRDFWDNKAQPELSSLREWLTWFVLPEFESIDAIKAEKVRVSWDIAHVGFLQEDADGIHTRARENFKAGGWTLNEFREATGMPPDPVKGSDYYVQPANVTVITPELRAQEAEKEPQQQPAQLQPLPDQNADPNAGDQPAKDGETASHEKKTYDYNGMTVGREPRGVELIIDLKAIAEGTDAEKAKISAVLIAFRDKLISQAAKELDKLDPKDAYTLTLTPDADARKSVRKSMQSAYRRGRQQITAELNAQRAAKSIAAVVEFKDDLEDDDFLDEITDLTISKIIAEIQQRAVNAYTTLRLLLDYTRDKLKEILGEESTKFIEQLAGNVANVAIRTGRDAEIENNLDEIQYCEYSAILDQNTCPPCEAADGQTAATPSELPDAPNPDCEGGANCRCFIVGVIV